ncbi:SMP-30/gluconolactonase/LRE family protein [Colwellia sp. 1_MG-2023]|uniref:SMP-30/gluconolactonase/LRE family protein n=1 Tax=Colwellia sp. 1_MG-2023 TaxID=3062649 RepID=UPI0026E1AB43|nr:SMP-30/gluconolactonase/LRE family protein [Colwellia sp. 1_MG-2023]MDO6444159.1 SMP-30/gluconolactonase/LRE family protein [Colwellia sp. 1_MG-2023]
MLKFIKVVLLVFVVSACQSSQLTKRSQSVFLLPGAEESIGSIEIYDNRAYKYLDEKTLISVRGKGFDWVEGPVWIKEHNFLLFTDIPKNIIRKFDSKQGVSVYLRNVGFDEPSDKGPGANGLLVNQDNQLVLMRTGKRTVSLLDSDILNPQNTFVDLVSGYNDMRLNGTNDGVFDNRGNLYFTDPPIGLDTVFNQDKKLVEKQYKWPLNRARRVQETPYAGIYRLSAKGRLELLDSSLTVPNGIGLSPDENTLYVAVSDKNASAWYSFDIQENGKLTNKQTFYDAQHLIGQMGEQGYPDGMAVHSSGVIFATGPGGVWLFDEKGNVLAKIKTGLLTSNCTFTTNEEYLFITADDYLLSVALK